jgi:hypothetical protein
MWNMEEWKKFVCVDCLITGVLTYVVLRYMPELPAGVANVIPGFGSPAGAAAVAATISSMVSNPISAKLSGYMAQMK